MIPLTACWLFDNSVPGYVNHSVEAGTEGGTAFEFIAQVTDKAYFGFSGRISGLLVDVNVAGSYGVLTWEYSSDPTNPATWTPIAPVVAYGFDKDKYLKIQPQDDWASVAFTAVVPHAFAPPDTVARYWLRVSAASVTTAATIFQIKCFPFALYSTPSRVARELMLSTTIYFTRTSNPTFNTVEDFIHEAEEEIDFRSRTSWKFNEVTDEYHDFNLNGFKLWKYPIISLYDLSIWDGGAWETKTQGRDRDYFYTPEVGMVYFSRFFVLPARFAYSVPKWAMGFGEFKDMIKVSYTYGRDSRSDPRFYQIRDLATKMVSRELILSHDYSTFVSSGLDKVALADKVMRWETEIESKLEEISGFVTV